MTAFNLLRQRCGLSQREAADFCGIALRTSEDWCSGTRRNAPHEAIDELRKLYALIETLAGARVAEIRREKPSNLHLKLPKSDKETKALGLPTRSAHAAMIAIVAARLDIAVTISE